MSNKLIEIPRVHNCLQLLLFITFFLLSISITSNADRVSEKIYSPLQDRHYCNRRLNATHSMGCQSELGGNVGVVWIVEDKNDLNHILDSGPTPPYIAVIKREHYTRDNLLNFAKYKNRIAGVVFLDINHNDSRLLSKPFSPEDRCPNRYSGLYVNDSNYGGCKQNLWLPESPISGLLYDDIPFPLFLMNDKDSVNEIETCFNENNIIRGNQRKQSTYPLCSMQLDSFMLAAINTEACLNSRSFMDDFFQTSGLRCYTVENPNIFSYFKPETEVLPPIDPRLGYSNATLVDPQSIVLIMTKLSSLSMFTEISPGADSTITSIVTLLAIAEALGHHLNDSDVKNSKRNIAFALLDSEPFDYTGSTRMVYNMQDNTFPHRGFRYGLDETPLAMKNLNLSAIDYIINLDQVAGYSNPKTMFLHKDPYNDDTKKLDKITDILKKTASNDEVNLIEVDNKLPLPPTSVHKFIEYTKSLKPDKKLMGLVISNYDRTYQNLFYHSIYDDSHNIYHNSKEKLVEHMTKVASFIAKSSFELAFGTEKSDIKVNSTLISELLDCYLINADCGTFTVAMQAGLKLPSSSIQTYKDPTKLSDDMNGVITTNLLTNFLGEKVPGLNLTACQRENLDSLAFNYQYINGQEEPIKDTISGVCVRSQVFMIRSTSPSFIKGEDRIIVDQKYPAWTVSLNNIRNPPRLFITSSPVYQWCVFVLGLVVTTISFIAVYQIRNTMSHIQSEANHQTGS